MGQFRRTFRSTHSFQSAVTIKLQERAGITGNKIIRRKTGPDPCQVRRIALTMKWKYVRPTGQSVRSHGVIHYRTRLIQKARQTLHGSSPSNRGGGEKFVKILENFDKLDILLIFPQSQPCNRYIYIIDQASLVNMAGYWPSSLFAFLWTETKSKSIKRQKENCD